MGFALLPPAANVERLVSLIEEQNRMVHSCAPRPRPPMLQGNQPMNRRQ